MNRQQKRTYLCILFSFLIYSVSFSQPTDGYKLENRVYVDYIKSIKFHIAGLPLTMPILDISSPSVLSLKFDDLSDEIHDYSYTIIHCNADWTRSNLSQMEFIDGFTEADIENYEFGYNTFTAFTNFQLAFPNRDMSFTKSGNYVLLIYNDDTDEPILTRRFCIVEPEMQIQAQIKNAADISKLRTHQEIDFDVTHRGILIKNPKNEIQATVIQNGNWTSALTGIRPLFIRPEILRFDYQNQIVFPGINEYRNLNLRSFQYRTENVFDIEDLGSSYNIYLKVDGKREFEPYIFVRDLNGNFIVENNHFDNFDLESDYGNVVFTLETIRPFPNSEVYIVGGMNDWQMEESNRMVYDETNRAYQGDIFLKQGFYNYMYAIKNSVTGEISYLDTEGNFFNAENEYSILVYYRPFGERYDRLVGVKTVNSLN